MDWNSLYSKGKKLLL